MPCISASSGSTSRLLFGRTVGLVVCVAWKGLPGRKQMFVSASTKKLRPFPIIEQDASERQAQSEVVHLDIETPGTTIYYLIYKRKQ